MDTTTTRGPRALRTWTAAAVALLCALGATACGASADRVDKAGGQTRVIRLATIDEVNDNGQSYGPEAFVRALDDVSGGRLKVEVTTSYGDGAARAESDLVHAISTGDVDGGWPSVRAFAEADIAGLEAVEAPMTITSYAAEKELVTGPVAADVLGRLDGTGLVGLGLAVGPLRRPFAMDAPLLAPGDWEGTTVRVYHSPTEAAAIHALGGDPLDLGFAQLTSAVAAGRLTAAEADIAGMAHNGGNPRLANVTTNVALWPKVYVLSLSQRFFDSLDEQQQGWVQQAAATAVSDSAAASYDESASATELCGLGFRFVQASPQQVSALRRAVQPVLDDLAASPDDHGLLAKVTAIGAAHPGPEPLTMAPDCTTGTSEDTSLGAIPQEVSALPSGTYRVEISDADLARSSLTNTAGMTGTWTLVVQDGTFQLSCRPLDHPGTDCGHEVVDVPLEAGDLRGTGQDAYFVYVPDRLSELTGCTLPVSQTRSGACFAGQDYKMTWTVDGDQLTFSHFVSDWLDPQYLVEPWTRIG